MNIIAILLLTNFNFLLLPESVDSTVSIALSTDKAAKSKGGEAASVNTSLIQMAQIQLNRRMVLCSYQPACRRAFSGDIKINKLAFVVLHFALNLTLNQIYIIRGGEQMQAD